MSPWIPIRLLAAQSDERLSALAAQGHARAFDALVHRYRRPLLRYCRRLGLSDSHAEDVLQHVFLQAWLALRGEGEVHKLKPWLYRVTHNAAVNALRRAPADDRLADPAMAFSGAAGAADLDGRLRLRDTLADVAALPPMQRRAIVLSAVEGHSHEQAAVALGVTPGAVRGLLHRARASLRDTAAAVVPQPLIGWACAPSGGSAPVAQRLVELSAGGGAAGVSTVLVKSAAVALTAGAIVGGTAVLHAHSSPPRSPAVRNAAGTDRATSERQLADGGVGAAAAAAVGNVAHRDVAGSARARSNSRAVTGRSPRHPARAGSSASGSAVFDAAGRPGAGSSAPLSAGGGDGALGGGAVRLDGRLGRDGAERDRGAVAGDGSESGAAGAEGEGVSGADGTKAAGSEQERGAPGPGAALPPGSTPPGSRPGPGDRHAAGTAPSGDAHPGPAGASADPGAQR